MQIKQNIKKKKKKKNTPKITYLVALTQNQLI